MQRKLETFVINLARRPDRLQRMSEQLARLDLPFSRIDAIDARVVTDACLDEQFSSEGVLGPAARGDQCCTLSHVRCWQSFANCDAQYALVLEDDAELHPDATALLRDLSWLPEAVRMLKIESTTPRVLVGRKLRVKEGTSIAELQSKHSGTGAYIIEKSLALWFLKEVKVWLYTLDHMLFNPHISPVTTTVRPYQLIPAIAWQPHSDSDTDIDEWRDEFRKFGLQKLKKSIRRAYSDVRVFPRQVLDVLSGRSALARL